MAKRKRRAFTREASTVGRRSTIVGGVSASTQPRPRDRSATTTIRTFLNQVNLFRKNLVRMRGVEDPFVGV